MTRVAILGGGPAGVGAAYRLRERGIADTLLVERNAHFGGNSGSFEHAGHRLDFGSHRLHPACDPDILADIRALLGEDLLDRPRHGRIRLLGQWVHFPLKPADLLLHLDKRFALGSFADAVKKVVAKPDEGDTFASVLQANLGRTICDHFYFPYAVKLWGHPPQALSGIQAHKRVSAGSFLKLARKILSAVPGLKPPGSGRFFYPRRGFGQISEAYAARAVERGADLRLSTAAEALVPPAKAGDPWRVTIARVERGATRASASATAGATAAAATGHESAASGPPRAGAVAVADGALRGARGTAPAATSAAAFGAGRDLVAPSGARETFEVDHLYSTLPLTVLARLLGDRTPREVTEAARSIDYRAMILVYLELPLDQFTEYDAHYFPGADVSITRLSEPKNYAARSEPQGRTVLCAELPCSPGDAHWSATDAELGQLVERDLAHSGLPLPVAPVAVLTRRLREAYPIYLSGYEQPFGVLDRWCATLPQFTSFGRQGLFAHDNTHHALAMAYAAADCLASGRFDDAAWEAHRKIFASHVVED